MKRRGLTQDGMVDTWLIAFIITLVVFFGAAGFGFWAYTGRQDYKNNVDAKIAEAVVRAEGVNSAKKDQEFLEREKEPLRSYKGPAAYGSVELLFPKTWSAYIDESGKSNAPLDGTLHPGFVPGLLSGAKVAVRFQVLNSSYAQTTRTLDNLVKTGKSTITPYRSSKVADVVGVRVDGEYQATKQGSMVVLPLRDKTLQIWTEGTQFTNDFNNIILPNLTFVP